MWKKLIEEFVIVPLNIELPCSKQYCENNIVKNVGIVTPATMLLKKLLVSNNVASTHYSK